jgi:hypothetical protein
VNVCLGWISLTLCSPICSASDEVCKKGYLNRCEKDVKCPAGNTVATKNTAFMICANVDCNTKMIKRS